VLHALVVASDPRCNRRTVGRLTWPTPSRRTRPDTTAWWRCHRSLWRHLAFVNAWTALFALAIVAGIALFLRIVARPRSRTSTPRPARHVADPRFVVAAGVSLGDFANPVWQRFAECRNAIRSEYLGCGVHANTIRFHPRQTGQRSPTHMGSAQLRDPTKRFTTRRHFTPCIGVQSAEPRGADQRRTPLNHVAARSGLSRHRRDLNHSASAHRTDEWRTGRCCGPPSAALSASFTSNPPMSRSTRPASNA